MSPDETGWRIGGRPAWLWAFAAPATTVYAIRPGRGFEAAASILGDEYQGVLVRDGWGVYRKFEGARQQSCLAHLLRRCRELEAVASGRGKELRRTVAAILKAALALRQRRDGGELTACELAAAVAELDGQLARQISRPRIRKASHLRLLNHLAREFAHLFTFLELPGVEATNWRAEQAIRPAVVTRKKWGGNRTAQGAGTQERVLSAYRTIRQRGLDPIHRVAALLLAPAPATLNLAPG